MDAQQYVWVDGVVVSAREAAKSGDPALQAGARQIEFDMAAIAARAEEQRKKAAERAAAERAAQEV